MTRSELEAYIRATRDNPDSFINQLYSMPEDSKADTTQGSSVYGCTFPITWMTTLAIVAQSKKMGIHTLVQTELEKLMSREQMVDASIAEGVTLTEIKRRLMVQAFPCLPKWSWPVRNATKSTPRHGQPSFKQKAVIIKEKAPTQIEFILPVDEFLVLKEQAMARAEMPSEFARRVIMAYITKCMKNKEDIGGTAENQRD